MGSKKQETQPPKKTKNRKYNPNKLTSMSLLQAARNCSFVDYPATIKDIQENFSQQQECFNKIESKINGQFHSILPSQETTDRHISEGKLEDLLLTGVKGADENRNEESADKALRRELISEVEMYAAIDRNQKGLTELSKQNYISKNLDEMEKQIDILSFQVCNLKKTSSKNSQIIATYRINPYRLNLSHPDKRRHLTFTDAEYIHQVSAYWQYVIDLASDHADINPSDANRLQDVLRHYYTLGEIPPHIRREDSGKEDSGYLNFSVLSNFTRHLHLAYKYEQILQNDISGKTEAKSTAGKVPLLNLTLGRLQPENGQIILRACKPIAVYPVSTCVKNGIYYLIAAEKTDNGYTLKHLRASHVLQCTAIPDGKLEKLSDLTELIEREQPVATVTYNIIECPYDRLLQFIDIFGKKCLSNCSSRSEEESGDEFWSFTIKIPQSDEQRLYLLHDEAHIIPVPTMNMENRNSFSWSEIERQFNTLDKINKIIDDLYAPSSKFTLDNCATKEEPDLLRAIQDNNSNQIRNILARVTASFDPGSACTCCYSALVLEDHSLCADIYQTLLPICSASNQWAVSLPEYIINTITKELVLPSNIPLSQLRLPPKTISLVSSVVRYHRPDLLELLFEYGASPNRESDCLHSPLEVAFKYQSLDCLHSLLKHPNLDKTLTDHLLTQLAGIGSSPEFTEICQAAAPVLLGCQCSKTDSGQDIYIPFPKQITLEHAIKKFNFRLFMPPPPALLENSHHLDTRNIVDAFMTWAHIPEETFCQIFADIMQTVCSMVWPDIIYTEEFQYLAIVAALSVKVPPSPNEPNYQQQIDEKNRWYHCVEQFSNPRIVLQECIQHNWFGKKGLLTEWNKAKDAINEKRRKNNREPLYLAIDRNNELPCDWTNPVKYQTFTNIMDLIFENFEIIGKAPTGSLSTLARHCLRYASFDQIEKQLQPGGLLATEDPYALGSYVDSLREFSHIPRIRRDDLTKLLSERILIRNQQEKDASTKVIESSAKRQ